jgi:hypothetical protein
MKGAEDSAAQCGRSVDSESQTKGDTGPGGT